MIVEVIVTWELGIVTWELGLYSVLRPTAGESMRLKPYKEAELLLALARLAAKEHRPLSDLMFEAIYEYLEARGALPERLHKPVKLAFRPII